MGISCAGMAITDDTVVSIASLTEIERRKWWYQEMVDRWEGKQERVEKCDELYAKAKKYCEDKKYDLEIWSYKNSEQTNNQQLTTKQ
jgi:uncharacterized protein (UPF0371 family)